MIEERGIAVIDVDTMPVFNMPYISPHFIIALNHRGKVEVEYDFEPVKFQAGDISVIYPRHTIIAHRCSPDYHATLVAVSETLFNELGILNSDHKRPMFEVSPHFHLEEKQYNDVKILFESMRRILNIELKNKQNILIGLLYTSINVIDTFHDKNVGQINDGVIKLSSAFRNAIIENSIQHRDVKFYAELFCVSPKHFSTVIKQETGHSAVYWIQDYVVYTAKQMLLYSPNFSIQTIADKLGFCNESAFCRYFKRTAHVSPTEYRAKHAM